MAGKELEIDALRGIAKGNWRAGRGDAEPWSCCKSGWGCRSGGHVGSSASTVPASATGQPSLTRTGICGVAATRHRGINGRRGTKRKGRALRGPWCHFSIAFCAVPPMAILFGLASARLGMRSSSTPS